MERNILLITIDALRYDCLTPEIMPQLCKLAAEGINYTNAYSEYGHTIASFQTLWENEWIYKLKQRGYYTIGINYNAYLSKVFGYDQGFDFWHDCSTREGPKIFIDDSKEINEILFNKLENHVSQPFFIWLHYMDCHTPYYPNTWTPKMLLADCGAPLVEITPKVIKTLRNLYNFAVKYIDFNLGVLFNYFRDKGIWDTLMVIVSADHGEEFYEHGKFGHDGWRTCDEVLHIPLVVKGHGIGTNNEKILFRDISNIILNNTNLNKNE